jgi:hypothetical protein
MENLKGVKPLFDRVLDLFYMVSHKDRQQKRQLLVDQIILTLPLLPQESIQFPLSYFNFLIGSNQYDIS